MNIGITGLAHQMLIKDEASVVQENLKEKYVHYDPNDNGYLLTQYDSNVATEWKKGADVLPLNETVERPVTVIKDVPFKPNIVTCSGSSSGSTSNNVVTGSGSGAFGD